MNTTVVSPCSGKGQAHVFLINSSPDADICKKSDHFLRGSQWIPHLFALNPPPAHFIPCPQILHCLYQWDHIPFSSGAEKPQILWSPMLGACAMSLAFLLPSSYPCVSFLKQQWEPEEFKMLVHCGFIAWTRAGLNIHFCTGWVGTGEFPGIKLNYSGIAIPRCISPKAWLCFELLQLSFHFSLLAWCSPHWDSIQHSLQKSLLSFGAVRGGWEVAAAWCWTGPQLINWYCSLEGDFFPPPNLSCEQFEKALI